MARVLIAVPTFETITPDTFKAIYDMDKGEHECLFEFVRGYDTATARNNIAMLAQDMCADYVMMIDSDVTPKKDALLNLIGHDKQIVTGFYMHRSYRDNNAVSDKTNVCGIYKPDGTRYFGYPAESQMTVEDFRKARENGEYLIEVHGGGMGCILIKTDVFYQVEYPWFDWVNWPNDERESLSEDLYFCEACHNEQIPIYVDSRVACGHLLRRIEYVE